MSTIAVAAIGCLKRLKGLVLSSNLEKFDSEVRQARWKDELGRLRVWAANIGAHQTGHLSLDYRLRDSSHIKDQTLRILQRLDRTLNDLQDVIYEPLVPDDFSASDDEEMETEIQLVYNALRDTINNLLQISMGIRRPAHHDRLSGTKRIDAMGFEPFDKQHVLNKFPNADPDIQNRLGLAISQRRAILRYRERHSKKLGQGLKKVLDDQSETQSTKLSDTFVTDFVQQPNAQQEIDNQTVISQTSYDQSLLHGSEGMVIPPPPAEGADGAPFECPYCYRIIKNIGDESWARHVFLDTMPYICVFRDCSTPHHLYESRREWYFHLQSQHSIQSDSSDDLSCPLCLSSTETCDQFKKHLGRHLEELALFALPRPGPEESSDPSQINSENGPLIMTLVPMNQTFELKQIIVPFWPKVLRIGRQTNAKTVPTPVNGFFDSKVLSRLHAEIWADKTRKIWIRDLKSANGTFLNGHRLSLEHRESEPHELRDDDVLELGIDVKDQNTILHHRISAKIKCNLSNSRKGSISNMSDRSDQSTASNQFNSMDQQCQDAEDSDSSEASKSDNIPQSDVEDLPGSLLDDKPYGPTLDHTNAQGNETEKAISRMEKVELGDENRETEKQEENDSKGGTESASHSVQVREEGKEIKEAEPPRVPRRPSTYGRRTGTIIYICCGCNDGPKLWDHQPQCISCHHVACPNCQIVQ